MVRKFREFFARDMRVAEVMRFDIHVEDGKPVYRTKLSVWFKYHLERQ